MEKEIEFNEEKPLVYMKRADTQLNRVIIPKFFIDKYGRDFYMEVYCENNGKERIVLIPIKNKEE